MDMGLACPAGSADSWAMAPAKTRTKTAMTMTLVALPPANSMERLQRDLYSEA
jgi:hypothetical protein